MTEAAPDPPSGDPGPQEQVYEAESSQEYFVRKEDGKVVDEVREVQQMAETKWRHYKSGTRSVQSQSVSFLKR